MYVAYRGGLHVVDVDESGAPHDGSPDGVLLADRDVECLAVHPDAPDRVFAGTFGGGLYRTADGGDSVERVGVDGIDHDAVTAVATSPVDPDEVWVGTEPSRLYRSADGGDSFEPVSGVATVPSAPEWSFPPRPDTHHVRWIEACPADPGRWYVGVEAGALVVTPDGGGTWIDRPPGSRRDNHTLATHPDAPDRVYAAAGDGYAESDDRGATWTAPQDGLDHRYVWGLAVDPGDPDTVLASAAAGAGDAHRRGNAYLYRKRGSPSSVSDGTADGPDAGSATTWERLDDRGIPTGEGTYRAVLAAGVAPGELWAVHDRGLYRTRDAGDSFERVPVHLPEATPRALVVAP